MERIEEFTKHGKRYVIFDMSHLKTNYEFRMFIETANPFIEKHKKPVICAIVNVEGVRFDTDTKELLAAWMKHNAPYVKYSVIIGMDGIKKMMLNAILAMSERSNVGIASNIEQAIETLKLKDWVKLDRWAKI